MKIEEAVEQLTTAINTNNARDWCYAPAIKVVLAEMDAKDKVIARLLAYTRSLYENASDDDAQVVSEKSAPVIPDGYCVMPLKLSAANGAKGALSGEFHISRTVTCHECGGEGCEDCSEQGQWEEDIPVGWGLIKLIYEAAVAECALSTMSTPEVS